jgi:peroxiredoxin
MVSLPSSNIELFTPCPDFLLPSVDGKSYGLSDFLSSEALLVAFICNHCPYVRAIESRLIELRKIYDEDDLAMVGICANDALQYPDDAREVLLDRWRKMNYGFPYLIDSEQTIAKAFGAVCTPDLFLYDRRRRLFYHGQLDDNWQDESKVSHHDLRAAIDAILADQPPPDHQKASLGCSIKWKK